MGKIEQIVKKNHLNYKYNKKTKKVTFSPKIEIIFAKK